MRKQKILKSFPDHCQTNKKMCEYTVEKLLFVIWYVPEQDKTQQKCDKAVLENGGTLESSPDCYKIQQMCNEFVDNYPDTLKFVLVCYMTQKMYDETVSIHPSTIKFIPNQFKTQEMGNKAVDICFLAFDFWRTFFDSDEAVDYSLVALKFLPDWLVTRKWLKNVLFLYIQIII